MMDGIIPCGSKGIALFVTDRNKPYLRYVFDVSDTGTRRSSPALNIWSITDEYRPLIQSAMERTFEVEAKGILEMQLETVAEKLTNEYWDEYGEQFFDIVEKKFFEEHREAITIHKAAKQAFDELGLKKIPRVKDLNEEYYKLMAEKKRMSSEYYETRTAMQELLKAQKNVEMFLEAEQKLEEKENQKEQDR